MDPFQIFSEKTLTLLQQTLEGLVRFGPSGKIEPSLAESWERIDPLTMRFHLRRGVRFHDGEKFDARAVKFSLERYVAPETRYPGFGFVETIKSVRVVDDYTVDVLTGRPDGLLLNRLAAWAHVVPPAYYAKEGSEGFSRHPVGTGPFRFESWEKGRRMTFSANPEYWMKGYPRSERLVFAFLAADAQVAALQSGEIDLTTELPGTLTTKVAQSAGIKVLKQPSFYAATGSFNINRGPLKSREVRQALNYAVNRQELIRYDLLGNGREIATVTMEGEEGHNDALKPYPYDPAKAARLLKAAGYPDGFPLKVLVKAQGLRTARIIAAQLAKVGVALELHPFTDAEILDALKRESWDMIVAGCPDPMAHAFFIQSIFLFSKSPYSLAGSEAYDQRLNRMVAALDADERRKDGLELDQYVYDEALMLFLYQRIKTYGMGERASFTPSITGMPYFYDARKAP